MIRFFADHPTASNMLMAIFLIAGIITLPDMQRETFPDFSLDIVTITVPYPGASALDVEEGVCRVVEDALSGTESLGELRAQAFEGRAVITAEMIDGGDFSAFESDIKTEIDALDNLPELAEKPVVIARRRIDPVVDVSVTGKMSSFNLEIYAEDLRRRLLRLPGVAEVEIDGFSQRQVRIEINREALEAYGLSLADIAPAVGRQSVEMPSGTLNTDTADILLSVSDERRSRKDLENIVVIGAKDGTIVHLKDIATVRRDYEKDEVLSLFNGSRAAVLKVSKAKGQDTISVFDRVSEFVEKERKRLPGSMTIALTNDMSSIVKGRLDLLVDNGAFGLLLVFFSLWLFFGIRLAFWVAMGLPVSFGGALFLMYHLGYTLNMMTMVGLLIALGLLMDDAIVIAENIAAHIEAGRPPHVAVVSGTSEVASGVISSFSTTAVVFFPLFAVSGAMGMVLRVIPAVLLLVLAVSLVEAFLVLPRHLMHSSIGPQEKRWFLFLRERILGPVVDRAVAAPYLTIGLTIFALFSSFALIAGGLVKIEAFPELDGDVIQARLMLPAGTPLKRTRAIVGRLVSALGRLDREMTDIQPGGRKFVKSTNVTFGANADTNQAGAHLAMVTANLLGAHLRKGALDSAIDRWRQLTGPVPDVISLNFTKPTHGPAGRAIEVRLSGNSLTELKKAALELRNWFSRFDGVYDMRDDLLYGKPEIAVTMLAAAPALGISARDVAEQLRACFQGMVVQESYVGRLMREIIVQAPLQDRDGLPDLRSFTVVSKQGRQVPLVNIARFERRRGWAAINRVNGRRIVTVVGNVNRAVGNTAEIMRKFRRHGQRELEQRHPSVRVVIKGESGETGKTRGSMGRAFIVGCLGVFLILCLQFRSYIEPLVVMAAIPFAFFGVILGHFVLSRPLTMPSLFGYVALAGVVVNDSILLVQFLKTEIRKGVPVGSAASLASRQRLRAVTLTSVTTIAGLLPLLFEKSMQAKALIPLATSTVFGLAASTAMVLVVVPSIYLVLADHGFTEAAAAHNRRPRA